ncbi:MAG: hypothetical protein CM15mP77_1310 [Synechococcus sp.]|nr:MAG: hypothetical protein CM15mP77_1310 [Synechococcus sp.]
MTSILCCAIPQPWMSDSASWEICDAVRPDLIVGIESRGFIVGTPLALNRSLGLFRAQTRKTSWHRDRRGLRLEYGTIDSKFRVMPCGNRGCWWLTICWPRVERQLPLVRWLRGRRATGGIRFVIELEKPAGRSACQAMCLLRR